MISFFVQGVPKAQPRVRVLRNGGRFTPHSADAWKESIVLQGRRYRPDPPLDLPLEVSIDFFLPRPRALMRRDDPEGPMWAPVTPDRDNLEKAVLDTLTDDGWWRDDSLVCAGQVRKLYHSKNGTPGARITVSPLFPFSDTPVSGKFITVPVPHGRYGATQRQ